MKIPAISSSIDTAVDVYYDNANVVNQQNVTGTWSNGFVGVWHLEVSVRGAGGKYVGSSGFGDHGTSGAVVIGGPPAQTNLANGKTGLAQLFDGIGDAITIGDVLDFGKNDPVTYSAWIRSTDAGESQIAGKALESGHLAGVWFDYFG